MRALHNGADRHAKRLAAVFAVVDASAKALAGHLGNAIAHNATARADRTLRPQHRFQILARGVVIMENRVAEIEFFAGHRSCLSTMRQSYRAARATST